MRRVRIDCAEPIGQLFKWAAALGIGCLATGCQPGDSLAGVGLTVDPPTSWRPVDPGSRMVPGKPLAAWSGPQGSSLVVYRALPTPGGTPESIGASLASRLTNLPGLEVTVQRVETVGGRPAARVEIVGPGTGDALAPSSIGKPMAPPGKTLISTREIVLGITGPDATLYLCWDFPESARDQILPGIEETILGLRPPGIGSTSSKSSY